MGERRGRMSARRSLDKRRDSAVERLAALSAEHAQLLAILKGLESALVDGPVGVMVGAAGGSCGGGSARRR